VVSTDPTGATVAFVDVPGHERFVTTTLAGVGPVPAVLLAIAADEGWMPRRASMSTRSSPWASATGYW